MQFPNYSVFVGEEAKKRPWSQKHAKEIAISIDCIMADVASSQVSVELDNVWDLWRRCAGIKLFEMDPDCGWCWIWLITNATLCQKTHRKCSMNVQNIKSRGGSNQRWSVICTLTVHAPLSIQSRCKELQMSGSNPEA